MDQHVNIWTKKTLYACMLIGLCSCSLAVPNGTSILLLDNFFFHRNLILGILNFTGLSTGLTSIFLYRAQPWCCCKLPIQLTLFLLKVKIHWNLGISMKGGKIAMRFVISRFFFIFIITGIKNIIHQTEDFIIIQYFISKKEALLQTNAVIKKKEPQRSTLY